MLRELTLRYAVKPDQTGQPIPVGRPLTDPRCAADVLMPVLAVEVLDHIIVGHERYASFKELGLL